MNWQDYIAIGLVAGVVICFIWNGLRPNKGLSSGKKCSGCPATASGPVRGSVVLKARKGGPVQVIEKFN